MSALARQRELKALGSGSSGLQKRREHFDKVRKSQKNKLLQAKRRKTISTFTGPTNVQELTVALGTLTQSLSEGNFENSLKLLRTIRESLSRPDEEPPIQLCIDHGIVRSIVQILDPCFAYTITNGQSDRIVSDLIIESSWIVSNLATGTSAQATELIAVAPFLAHLANSTNVSIVDQSMWAIGNLAADSQAHREALLRAGCLSPIIKQISLGRITSESRTSCWALCNLLRGSTPTSAFYEAGVIQALHKLCKTALKQCNQLDTAITTIDVLTECAWTMAYLAAREVEFVQILLDSGYSALLLDMLMLKKPKIILPTLRAIGNITGCQKPEFTDIFLQHGAFLPTLCDILSQLARGARENIVVEPSIHAQAKEALWLCCNIAANPTDKTHILLNAPFLESVRQHLHGVFAVRQQALQAIYYLSAVACSCYDTGIRYMLLDDMDVLSTFVQATESPDIDLVRISVSYIHLVAKFSPKGKDLIEQVHGIDALERLVYQGVGDEDSREVADEANVTSISEYASQLLDEYFGEDDYEDTVVERDDDQPTHAGQQRGMTILPAWMQ